MSEFQVKPVGDQALLAVFEQKIDEEISRQVLSLAERLKEKREAGVRELVPAFASLLVYYDPMTAGYEEMKALVEEAAGQAGEEQQETGKLVEIPVCYGGQYGEDLEYVAEHAGLTAQEVIALHSGREYRIYMLGFLPGFPYLGGLDRRLFTPRLSNPRTRILAGSVGIGGEQTGIYPCDSAGGWQLIGRTPQTLFTPGRGGKFPYQAGDRIRFVPIGEKEFEKWHWR